MIKNTPLVLTILDGFGYSQNKHSNAISHAYMPQWNKWWENNPHILLKASGKSVGLPEGQMGNSEVGHMHIGAGRTIYQDFTRINEDIRLGTFFKNDILVNAIKKAKAHQSKMHIIGLLSPGGVHSHESHLFAFLQLYHQLQFSNSFLHLFLDGRDCSPQSALESIKRLNHKLAIYPVAKIASITGRYYAMDRDKKWDRIAPVYHMLTQGDSANQFDEPNALVNHYYRQGITDEFIPPCILKDHQKIEDGDSIFFFNYRADRARQLSRSFTDESFNNFKRESKPRLLQFLSMTHYADDISTTSVYPPALIENTLGEVLAKHQCRQLRIAETEKYAHVTFFFNGGIETPYPFETRQLIKSPMVKTYDLKPEMSAYELTDEIVKAIENNAYDVIICNYANADMVGHSGDMQATIKAVEVLDECLKKINQALKKTDGLMLITADHGNAECMFNDELNQPHTAHTTEPVPLLLVGSNKRFIQNTGKLSDIAPTILHLLGLPIPEEMTGNVLLSDD